MNQTYNFSLTEFQYKDLLAVFADAAELCTKIAARLRDIEEPLYAASFDEDATRLSELYNLLTDAGNLNFTQYFFNFDLDNNTSRLLCNALTGAENTADAAAKALLSDGKQLDARVQELKAGKLHDLNVIMGTRRRNHD